MVKMVIMALHQLLKGILQEEVSYRYDLTFFRVSFIRKKLEVWKEDAFFATKKI